MNWKQLAERKILPGLVTEQEKIAWMVLFRQVYREMFYDQYPGEEEIRILCGEVGYRFVQLLEMRGGIL